MQKIGLQIEFGAVAPLSAATIRALVAPVFPYQSPAVLPGTGIIALTKMSLPTDIRSQTTAAATLQAIEQRDDVCPSSDFPDPIPT